MMVSMLRITESGRLLQLPWAGCCGFGQVRSALLQPELLTAGETALVSRQPFPDDDCWPRSSSGSSANWLPPKPSGAGWLTATLVVPDGGGEGEEPLQDACDDTAHAGPVAAFKVELGFEGLVDPLDYLAERSQETLRWPWQFGPGGGTDEPDATASDE